MVKVHPQTDNAPPPPQPPQLPPGPGAPRQGVRRKYCCCITQPCFSHGEPQGCHCSFSCCFFYFCLCFTLALFILGLIFFSREIQITVTAASLTQFNFTKNDTLFYNLALDITIRNPNKKIGMYFNQIQANANYKNNKFSMVTSNETPFYQGHKNTTVLHITIEGQQFVLFGECELDEYKAETSSGIYSIDLELALIIRTKYGLIKSPPLTPPKITCELKIPLCSNINDLTSESTTGNHLFTATRCENVHILTT